MRNARLPLGVISEREMEAAEDWVSKNVVNRDMREIFGKMILQARKYLYHSQIPVEEADCALILRPWGNEIYLTDSQDPVADETRLKLAVAVRALASEEGDPGLWRHLTDFSEVPEAPPELRLMSGGEQ